VAEEIQQIEIEYLHMTEAGQDGLALQSTGIVSAAEEPTHPKRSYHSLEASKIQLNVERF
jgi:hypothetical protein